ncbi:MAG: carboxypeptidase-like regulatory domain-containing protein, partial [Patescibacteria group bacterium]|nr:carboxypeptidase-like regulatory domain-containing protein [Patescibacteria group bacterium]
SIKAVEDTTFSVKERFTQTTQDISDTVENIASKSIKAVEDTTFSVKERFTQTTQDISDTTKETISNSTEIVVSTYNKVVSGIKKTLSPEEAPPPLVEPKYISPQTTLTPKDIPLDTLIAKSKFGNISLEFTPEGKFNLLAGTTFKAFIKPSKPVISITGKVLLETTASETPVEVSFIDPIPFLGNVAHAFQEVQAKIWLVQEYTFQDPDKDGIYTASISIPPIAGDYVLRTSLFYADGELKEIETETLVDPQGYIYRLDPDGLRARIIDAVVTLYYFNLDTNQYEPWIASAYDQKNPQITDNTGDYAFFVPEGKYYITVSAKNYSFYQSEEFLVSEGKFIHQNIELEQEGGLWNRIKRIFNR